MLAYTVGSFEVTGSCLIGQPPEGSLILVRLNKDDGIRHQAHEGPIQAALDSLSGFHRCMRIDRDISSSFASLGVRFWSRF